MRELCKGARAIAGHERGRRQSYFLSLSIFACPPWAIPFHIPCACSNFSACEHKKGSVERPFPFRSKGHSSFENYFDSTSFPGSFPCLGGGAGKDRGKDPGNEVAFEYHAIRTNYFPVLAPFTCNQVFGFALASRSVALFPRGQPWNKNTRRG